MSAIGWLVVGVSLCATVATLAACFLTPVACIVLAFSIALAPAACAWCLDWCDRQDAIERARRAPLKVETASND